MRREDGSKRPPSGNEGAYRSDSDSSSVSEGSVRIQYSSFKVHFRMIWSSCCCLSSSSAWKIIGIFRTLSDGEAALHWLVPGYLGVESLLGSAALSMETKDPRPANTSVPGTTSSCSTPTNQAVGASTRLAGDKKHECIYSPILQTSAHGVYNKRFQKVSSPTKGRRTSGWVWIG